MLTPMNYILQLKDQAARAEAEVSALRAGLHDLRSYLMSPKFRCGDRLDGYINTGDVLAYVRNAETAGIDARER
jgi:hypothetical protein